MQTPYPSTTNSARNGFSGHFPFQPTKIRCLSLIQRRKSAWSGNVVMFGFWQAYWRGSATRKCAVPEGTGLFSPVANIVFLTRPNVCQGPESIPIEELRAAVAAFVDGVTNIAVEVDGKPIRKIHRVGRSIVYAVALPEDNVFDEPCIAAGLGDVPAGIYSPTVDDGLYVKLDPLERGNHTLHFHAEDRAVLSKTYV